MKTERNLSSCLFFMVILIVCILNFAGAVNETVYSIYSNMNWAMSVIVAELSNVLPALIILAVWYLIQMWKESADDNYVAEPVSERIMFRGVKISSLLMSVLLAYMILPICTLVNAISMLFVDNVMLESSNDIVGMTFVPAVILIAFLGPACEEFVFRGMIFGGYRKACSLLSAVIASGLCFGLMHMNFNQFGYAFVMGCLVALTVEATGSIIPGFVIHFIFNFQSTAAMFFVEKISGIITEGYDFSSVSNEQLRPTILIYSVISVVTTTIACVIISWLAKNEGRVNPFTILLKKPERGTKVTIFDPFLIVGSLIAVALMVLSLLK